MARKEEEKSYAVHFLVLSFLLIVFSLLALRREVVDLRPWKEYQKQYYQLESARLEREREKAKTEFEQPEAQEQYRKIKGLLAEDVSNGPIPISGAGASLPEPSAEAVADYLFSLSRDHRSMLLSRRWMKI